MTKDDFEQRWRAFRRAVFVGELTPEDENTSRMCFLGGMAEMYGYLTDGIPKEALDDEQQAHALLRETSATLRTASAQVIREGFQLLGEDDVSH